MRSLLAGTLSLCVVLPLAAADKKLPGKAEWDLQAFDRLFNVVGTSYDEAKREVRWTLETKEAYRTSDFVREIDKDRPFSFIFRDAGEKELATVGLGVSAFKGIPKDRVMPKGTRLELRLEVPNVLDKAATVVLRRGSE